MKKQMKLMSWPIKVPSNFFTGFLMINHPPVEGQTKYGFGDYLPYHEEKELVSDDFIKSLCDYYKESETKLLSLEWDGIVSTHGEFIELLNSYNIEGIREYLNGMWIKPLMSGLAQGEFFYNRLVENKDDILTNTGFAIYDKFITLMEMSAIIPTFSPEQYLQSTDYLKYYSIPLDTFIRELSLRLGIIPDIQSPKFQGGHFGLVTEHGLFSDRDIMSLGTAIKLFELYWNNKDIQILNIGGGIGYLEFYLKQLGFNNVIDILELPTIGVAGKNFPKIRKLLYSGFCRECRQKKPFNT